MGLLIGSTIACVYAGLLAGAVLYAAGPDAKLQPLEENRAEAAAALRRALDRDLKSAEDRRTQLAKAGRRAADLLKEDSLVAADLIAAIEDSDSAEDRLEAVRASFESAYKTLTFQPLVEADLPRGFPSPGPLGEIRVKEYPAYRMAVSDAGGAAFWRLFQHIQRNDIAMTAPVEMSYGEAEAKKPAEESMAFLYGNPEMGRTGVAGSVEVVDASPATVVSIGLNGRRSDARIQQARDQLMAWIEKSPEYSVSGRLRVLGYNSPFVPRERQYWEVQVPITRESDSSDRSP